MAKLLSRARTIAVVDVGSGYIGCALVAAPHAGAATVIGYGHARLSLEKRTYVQSRAHITAELSEAIAAAQNSAGASHHRARISEVHVVLHAPWISSQVVTVAEAMEKSTYIDASRIALLAKKTLSGHDTEPAQLLEKQVIAIKLNGYPTLAAEGKHAETIELSAMLGTGDPSLTKSLETELRLAFPAAKLTWLSAENAYTMILRKTEFSSHALIVDVGVSETNLIVLEDGIPQTERSVPEGLRGMLARMHGLESPADTLAMLRMHARDACENDACTALQKAIAAAEPDLVKVFGEHFAKLAETRHLPNTLLLVAHPDATEWLTSFFDRIDFAQFTVTTMPFTTVAVTPDMFSWLITSDPHMDASLALASASIVLREQST